MKVCLLFGSGVSVPAGMPNVDKITERVLTGDDLSHVPNSTDFDSRREARQTILRWLEIQVKRRYASEPNRPVNYEDLYFLASQIRDDLDGEYDNPAVRPLVENAFAEVLPSVARSCGTVEEELKHLSEDVIKYMRRCVMSLLLAELQPLDYLEFVAEAFYAGRDRSRCRVIRAARRVVANAFQASSGRGLDILTLNHDTVLERFLESRGIPFADGFAKELNAVKVREWQPATLHEGQGLIRLMKLHGGVDWFRFRPDGVQDWSEDYIGIRTFEYRSNSLRDERQRQYSILGEGLPIFLIGTFNKLANYTDRVYLEIYYESFQSLDETDVLVIVGYGFGDKGINKLITDWMCRTPGRRLVVIDRDANNLWKRARGAIAGKWQGWLDARRLFPVDFNLENKLTWERIASLLS